MSITYIKPKFDKKYRKESAEAVDWLLLLKSGEMGADQRHEFENWLLENPENAEQFKLINALWDSTRIMKDDPFTVSVLKGESVRNNDIDSDPNTKPADHKRKTIAKAVALAAMVLIAVVSVLIGRNYLGSEKVYYTSTGEQKSVFLDDGSVIQLDSETKVMVIFTRKQRQISMEKGRAVYSVAHDPGRPFIVDTGNMKIRAVGTKFDVSKLSKTKVSVSVTEGKVLVTSVDPMALLAEKVSFQEDSAGQISRPVKKSDSSTMGIIAKGEKIVVNEQIKVYEIQPVDIKNVSSWSRGRLYFKRTELQDVLDEVNIYLNKKIVIGDSSLKGVEIDMNFDIRDCQYFLSTLKKVVPVESQLGSGNRIIITKAL